MSAKTTNPKATAKPKAAPATKRPASRSTTEKAALSSASEQKPLPRPPRAAGTPKTAEPTRAKPRKRRTVPTSTGRRRLSTARPAPHPSAPKSRPPEDADPTALAPLTAQKTREEPSKSKKERTLPIEIDPERIEQSLRKLGGELTHWARQGRYTKVRFRFRGKPLLPDLPLAAVVAAEGLTFYWGGILRALLMNVAGKTLLDVELVHDAEKEIQAGKEALLSGDLDEAIAHHRRATHMQRDGAQAHLHLGVALKLKGLRDEAKGALERAFELDPQGPVGAEAKRLLETL